MRIRPSHYISIRESCQHLGERRNVLIRNTIYYTRGNPNTPCVGVGGVVGDGGDVIRLSENPLVCVRCAILLLLLVGIYILYIITV